MQGVLTRSIDARAYAVVRIFVGLAWLPLTFEWSKPLRRVADPKNLAVPFIEALPRITPIVAYALIAVAAVAGIMMILGVAAKVSSAVVAVTGAVVLLVDQQTMTNHLLLMVLLATFVACSDCGGAWTVTDRRSSRLAPYWPAFLIKAQLTSLYAWTAIAKVNPEYLAGTVVEDHLRFDAPFAEVILPAISLASIVIEAFLAVALWVPKLRIYAFIVGFGLHVGIILTLANTFPLLIFVMLVFPVYVLFFWDSSDRKSGYEYKLWRRLVRSRRRQHALRF